jgi:hypothetical protein
MQSLPNARGDAGRGQTPEAVGLGPSVAESVGVQSRLARPAVEVGLHRRDDPPVGHAGDGVVAREFGVFDPVTGVGRVGTVGVCVEDGVDRLVADGVGGDLKAGRVGTSDLVSERRGRRRPLAALVRRVGVRRRESRRPGPEAAVGERLDRADADQTVAVVRPQARLDQGVEVVRPVGEPDPQRQLVGRGEVAVDQWCV